MVLVLGILVIVGTVLFLLIEPVYRDHQRLRADLPRLEQDLAWMRQQLAQSKARQRPVNRNRPGQVVTAVTVEQSIEQAGLEEYVTELRPDDNGGVRIDFEKVSYLALTEYIYQLREQYGAMITMAKIQDLDKNPGMVDATLLLVSGSDIKSGID